MAKTFHLTIAKVGENLFDGEAQSAILPGAEGVFTILPHHEAFVSELKPGEAHVVAEDGSKQSFTLGTAGVAEISNNQATVLL